MGDNIQSDPIDANRRIPVRLVNGAGNGVPGQVGAVAITCLKDNGAWGAVDAATTLTEDAGAADGDYTLNSAILDWDTVGVLKYKITGPNTQLFRIDVPIVPNASGNRMRRCKARAGAAGSVQLDVNASAVNNFYAGGGSCSLVVIVSGTGKGQSRLGVSYVGASTTLGVSPNWVTNPDNTSVVDVIAFPGILDATAYAAIQAGLATDAHVLAIPTNPLATNDARLNNLNAPIAAIPTTPLLANDVRLNHLDVDIGTRAAPGAAMALTGGERNATADAIIARPIGAPAAGSVGAAILAGGGGGGGGATAQQILDTVIEGPNQYDGNGEALPVGGDPDDYNVTLAQALREILAYASHNATGLVNAIQTVIKSRAAGRNRIVAQIVNGNRTITSRDNS